MLMMKQQSRLKRLCKILKDENNIIYYSKLLPRLRFKINTIWVTDEILFCMIMSDSEVNYIDVDELNMEELESIISDLENILAE
jgi:hypothetical protein